MKTITGIVFSGILLLLLLLPLHARAQEKEHGEKEREEEASEKDANQKEADDKEESNPSEKSEGNTLSDAMKALGERAHAAFSRRPASARLLRRRILHRMRALSAAGRGKGAEEETAKLLLDNARLIQGAADALAHTRRVPLPVCGRTLRVDGFAAETLRLIEKPLDAQTLREALYAFDEARALSLAELDALPSAFRRVILLRTIDALRGLRNAKGVTSVPAQTLAPLLDTLRVLDKIDFPVITQSCSSVCALLELDPADVYAAMDDDSQRLYREAVARIAQHVALGEPTVVQAALALGEGESDLPKNHIGYYLLDDGIPELYARLGGMPASVRFRRFLSAHAGGFLIGARLTVSALLGLAFCALGVHAALLPLCMLVASPATLALISRLIHALFPPRPLPALALPHIPEAARTLVVVPTLLSSRESAAHILEHLEVIACAGGDAQLEYLLLGDYRDSEAAQEIDDADIASCIREGVERLNAACPGKFYYLHRKRVWDDAHKRYMGPMRKRGALMCLCELIERGETDMPLAEITFDPAHFHHRYRYILTLDSDTLLPPGYAQRLVGAMEHPLCRANILAPRMESAARLLGTHLADMLGGPGGMALYQGGTGDLYQDLCGYGSFAGKGLLRVQAYFERTREVPARYALSHDLLEGELCGCALMENAALYDGPCTRLAPFFMQLERWTRGDWQLLPWLFPRVLMGEKHSVPNPLSLLSRVKIYDNLRRSLVAPAQLALLFITAILGNGPAFLLALLLPHLNALLCGRRRALLDAYTRVALLPRFALLSLRAAGRALYRQFISGVQLLDWVTAGDAQKSADAAKGDALQGWCAAALVLLSVPELHALYVSLWVAIAFVLAPRLVRYLNAPAHGVRPLDESERAALTRYARATWAFFERVVTAESRHLPPDNLQIDPPLPLAARTSPTNIGLYLLSCVSAQQLGLITPDEMLTRLTDTLQTLQALPTWHGHLYNWYDTHTGEIAPPAYVSSVDSGNYLACVIACAQALRANTALGPDGPVLADAFDALIDATDIPALYDASCELFYIGAQLDEDGHATLPDLHYEHLASESRLLSYVAVARGAVPLRHWQRLGRKLTRTRYGNTILSWSGTMFEYLMPRLLQRDAADTLLSRSCQNAALVQMTLPGIAPWGISESGRANLDEEQQYQYHAFGVPQLALRETHLQRVIAPYAGALALCCFPHAAIKNLMHMESIGYFGELGFYEAADYTAPEADHAFTIVKSHMSHHQGMLLCATCNALTGNALVNFFHRNAQMEAFSLLLEEQFPG